MALRVWCNLDVFLYCLLGLFSKNQNLAAVAESNEQIVIHPTFSFQSAPSWLLLLHPTGETPEAESGLHDRDCQQPAFPEKRFVLSFSSSYRPEQWTENQKHG